MCAYCAYCACNLVSRRRRRLDSSARRAHALNLYDENEKKITINRTHITRAAIDVIPTILLIYLYILIFTHTHTATNGNTIPAAEVSINYHNDIAMCVYTRRKT